MHLEIETSSACNRCCPECLRQAEPDRELVSSWTGAQKLVPLSMVRQILEEGREFTSSICLSHYNEPMLDRRIGDLAEMAREIGYQDVWACTAAPPPAWPRNELRGFTDLVVSRNYAEDDVMGWLELGVGAARFVGPTKLVPHFPGRPASPHGVCPEPQRRLIVNHRGQYLLCCEDMVGRFGLGEFNNMPISEFLGKPGGEFVGGEYGNAPRSTLVWELARGIRRHPHCQICPRGTP